MMLTSFFVLKKNTLPQLMLVSLLLSLIIPELTIHGQAGVVGYSTKVFADGPVKIKAGNPTTFISAFKKDGVAFVVPDGWKMIMPQDGYYHDFPKGSFTLNLVNDKQDQAWIWREKVKIGYFIDEKSIVDELTEYAPINQQIKTIHINGDGPDVKLYIWRAYHLKEGKKKAFTVYYAIKPAPVFNPNTQNVKFFARSADALHDDETEADIIEMLKYIHTYDETSEQGKKKKGSTYKTIDDQLDEMMADVINKAFENFEFEYISKDEDEVPAEYNGKKMDWHFQTYPGWAKDIRKTTEMPVSWMVPSLANTNNEVIETIRVTSNHLMLLYDAGLAMFDTKKGAMLWYHKLGFRNSLLAAGNQEKVIICRPNYGENVFAFNILDGKELWSAELAGKSPDDWLLDHQAGVIIAVQLKEKETILTALDLSTGEERWSKTIGHNAGLRSPPLPELIDSRIICYSNGVAAVSSDLGEILWEMESLKLEDRCPNPQILGDTVIVIDKSNHLHSINATTGQSIEIAELRNSSEYTNIYPAGKRVYLRGRIEDKNEKEPFFIDALNIADGIQLWTYMDSTASTSNFITTENEVYVSSWKRPLSLDSNTGKLLFQSILSEVGKTYPVSIRKYGDTIVYIGELVIASIDGRSGKTLYRIGFDPVEQHMNLDAIDPNCEALVEYLKFFGKVGLEGNTMAYGDAGYFFNLSNSAQEQATKLSTMASHNRSMYSFTGESNYYYKSAAQYNSSLINKSFSKAYASVGMMMNIVPRMSQQVAEMTEPERKRYFQLLDNREELMALYQRQEAGDYAFRIMKVEGFNSHMKVLIIHLPSGKVIHGMEDARSMGDIILNPEQNEYYYHELRSVPELEKISENIEKGTTAHSYYLVAKPLKQ